MGDIPTLCTRGRLGLAHTEYPVARSSSLAFSVKLRLNVVKLVGDEIGTGE